jgi:hypothetical protein
MDDKAGNAVITAAAFIPRPRLFDVVRDRLRVKHYSLRTERSCLQWMRRFILFHGRRHPRNLGAAEIEAFLSHLAVNRAVAALTQNQSLAELLCLYRDVMALKEALNKSILDFSEHEKQENVIFCFSSFSTTCVVENGDTSMCHRNL